MKKLILFLYFKLVSFVLLGQTATIDSLFLEARKPKIAHEQRIEIYSQLIALDPSSYLAYFERGHAYGNLWFNTSGKDEGLMTKALQDYETVLEINPSYHSSYFFQAFIYNRIKENDLAIKAISKAISLDIENYDYYRKRATFYQEVQEYSLAKTDLSITLQLLRKEFGSNLKPKPLASILYNRAYCYAKLEDYQNALKDIKEAIRLDPDEFNFLLFKGDVYAEHGELKKALKVYSSIIKSSEIYVIAYLQRGKIFYALGEHEKATADWQKAKAEGISVDFKTESIKPGFRNDF